MLPLTRLRHNGKNAALETSASNTTSQRIAIGSLWEGNKYLRYIVMRRSKTTRKPCSKINRRIVWGRFNLGLGQKLFIRAQVVVVLCSAQHKPKNTIAKLDVCVKRTQKWNLNLVPVKFSRFDKAFVVWRQLRLRTEEHENIGITKIVQVPSRGLSSWQFTVYSRFKNDTHWLWKVARRAKYKPCGSCAGLCQPLPDRRHEVHTSRWIG